MCGIFGYIGNNNAVEKVIQGLKKLEYRGYDSWGVSVQSDNKLYLIKKVGKIGEIQYETLGLPKSKIGIGHTRWATTGRVSEKNAHPHLSSDNSFALAQNGIVENYKELKKSLIEKGHNFVTETDTEVIVKLIEEKLKSKCDFRTAITQAFIELKGRNTIIIMRSGTNEIFAARNGSPLVIGFGENNEGVYISSDALSFAAHCKKMVVIDNGQLVHIQNREIHIYNIISGSEVKYGIEDVNLENNNADKEGFEHFMIKEIYENPFVIEQVIGQDKNQYEKFAEAIKKANNVYTLGSGTAGMAAAQIAYYLRAYSNIKAVSLVGADAREYFNLFKEGDLIIAPSQSGETADVLEVLEYAKLKGVVIASYVNMPGSLMTRISDYKFMANAGPEICVMSTKIFVSQIAWGYLIAKTVAGQFEEAKKNLQILKEKSSDFLKNEKTIQKIKDVARNLSGVKDIFLMGKSQNLQIMNEGMVKLIEGSYKHAHSIPAGDLKHYAITLMEEGVHTIAAISDDIVKSDMLNAINQINARGAKVIAIASEDNELFDYFIPVPKLDETSAIINVMALQLLAYYLTLESGNDVDKPRNIAKCVTVK